MTFIRSVAASVLLVFFVSVGSLAAAGAGSNGSTEGTFVGIEQADGQAHFVIKEKGGSEDSFIILGPDESVKPYLDNPAKFKGHAVKVYWRKKFVGDGFRTSVVRVE